MKDMLIEMAQLRKNDDFVTYNGVWCPETEKECAISGVPNRGKINPKEPDFRLYRPGERNEFISLWKKVSKAGRKYLIGNKDGCCYIGLFNFNKFSDSDPDITVYRVLKFN